MKAIWGSSREPELNTYLSRWACTKLYGHDRGFGHCIAMGVRDGDKIVGVMVYHNYDPDAGIVEITGVSDTKEWLKRHILFEMFSYPFDDIKCQMVLMRVSERNVQWNGRGLPRLLKSYGFTSVRVPRLYGRDEDGIIYTLTEEAWRANGFHRKPFEISHSPVDTVAA